MKPYWGKPAVRNFRGGDGNVGIIRSPVRAIALPDRIELTAKEFALLEYLMRHAGRQVTRSMIIENVWNLTFDTTTNVVDVYINYLRRKIDDGHSIKLIQTVRGIGYAVKAPAEIPAPEALA